MADDEIERQLSIIRKTAPKKHDPRGRFAAEHFLREVFRFYRKLKQRDENWNTFHRYTRGCELNVRRAPTIRQIIDLTCCAPPKMKSRWYRALRYAWARRREFDDFIDWMRGQGGPSALANEWARLQPPRPDRSSVRVGDPGMPPIPLFVDPKIIDGKGNINVERHRARSSPNP